MACHCWYLVQILTKCCFCYKLRLGVLMFGCIFFMWFIYLTLGTAFMMESIFPNEYQTGDGPWCPSALKTTMVFSFFGIFASGLLCIGVHNNNEMLFLPFLVFAPVWILVHILSLVLYSFKLVVIALIILTMVILIYAWIVVWSYYVELLFAYDDELETNYV
ncbi:uncharacterized protein Dana_GF26803 [Drosophila ananassae]|uniref:Transmembrane protein n=1 Tax=Drosophila ananassae TaxID=7217 RepID=A0A0P8YAQ3_DROAN|nr:uncharacterized protein LOC26514212 [Drosophila ananassae]KPU76138.1 uncharacterized protein Dana_GF26803 [Drosophila ananassae]